MIKYELNNGVTVDALGYGTYKLKPEIAKDLVLKAFEAGYRRIDTASFYNNEEAIGQAIKESGLERDEIFVTTKVWVDDFGYEKTKKAFNLSLKKLGLDYVDMYLLHWPRPNHIEAYKVLEELYDIDKTKAIGVCNYNERLMEELLESVSIKPAINQVELHPEFSQREISDFCENLDIMIEAWSPLMRGRIFEIGDLDYLAKKYNKTISQVTLRWHIQHGRMAIPKTETISRLKENIDIFDFVLEKEDMEMIDYINLDRRISSDPEEIYAKGYDK